jgi:hypothetical protein
MGDLDLSKWTSVLFLDILASTASILTDSHQDTSQGIIPPSKHKRNSYVRKPVEFTSFILLLIKQTYRGGGRLISKSSAASATLPTMHFVLACICGPGIASSLRCICKCSMKLPILPKVGAVPPLPKVLHPLPTPSAQQKIHPNAPKLPSLAVGPSGMLLHWTCDFARKIQR